MKSAEEHLDDLGNCVWVTDHAGTRVRVPHGEDDHPIQRAAALVRARDKAVSLATINYMRSLKWVTVSEVYDDGEAFAHRLGRGETP